MSAGSGWRGPTTSDRAAATGSDAAGLERDALRHHELERRVRGRRADGQREVALGSGSQSGGGAAEDLLRRRESRDRASIEGKIIAPVIDGRLQALDAETGKPVWEAASRSAGQHTITMAPRIAKGKVIIGVSGGDIRRAGSSPPSTPTPGSRVAVLYRPGDPSKPFENAAMKKAADTWDGDWWKFGGGGTVGTAWPTTRTPSWSTSAPATAGLAGGAPQVKRQGQSVCLLDPRGRRRHR